MGTEPDSLKIENTERNTDVLTVMLDRRQLKYKVLMRTPEKTQLMLHFVGNDLPMTLYFVLRTDRQLCTVLSVLHSTVPEERRSDFLAAVAAANHGLIDGSFDFNTESGELRFRLTSCYLGSVLSEELFSYLMYVSAETVDRYNDLFQQLADGAITLEDFLADDRETGGA